MPESVDHQIGRISGRMDSLDSNFKNLEARIERRLDAMDARNEKMETKINTIHDAVTSVGGSWRALLWIGAAFTGLASLSAVVVHWITGR